MKLVWNFIVFALFVVCVSMTQCPKCIKGRLKVDDDAKQWIPYKNKDSVSFTYAGGNIRKFRCLFSDTTREYRNRDCDDTFSADSSGASLEIDSVDSLFIGCQISSPSWMCVRAISRNSFYLSICDIIHGPVTEMRRSFSSLQLNNFLYNDVRLINAYPGTNPAFDSIYFAKDYGVISFKYNNISYFLQH